MRILFVDDCLDILDLYKAIAQEQMPDAELVFASTKEEGERLDRESKFDVVIFDRHMPNGTPNIKHGNVRILNSGYPDPSRDLLKVGLDAVFTKPEMDWDLIRFLHSYKKAG